jgi:hypothetical protein
MEKGMTRDGEEGSRYRYGLALPAIYPDHLPTTIDNTRGTNKAKAISLFRSPHMILIWAHLSEL